MRGPEKPISVAIIGTRGVPATYGGFETFAEELGAQLASRGHAVTVYGRSHVVPAGLRTYRGMDLRVLPTIRHKYFDTVVHTALCILDLLPRRFDVVLICNNANAPLALLPRLTGAKVVLNVDGLEWMRGKWGLVGRSYYQACAWLAPKLPITLVSDAMVIATWYRERYGKSTVYIPYGSDSRVLSPGATLARLGLNAQKYILYVSRLEPENNAHIVMDAYLEAGLDVPLVVVGDAPYASEYKSLLQDRASRNENIRLVGALYGDAYVELQSNAAVYVQATEVGGTHPALVEAMARGICVVANDVPEHREVLGDAGAYYARNDASDLARVMVDLMADSTRRTALADRAAAVARAKFSWASVTDSYEALFRGTMHVRRDGD